MGAGPYNVNHYFVRSNFILQNSFFREDIILPLFDANATKSNTIYSEKAGKSLRFSPKSKPCFWAYIQGFGKLLTFAGNLFIIYSRMWECALFIA